MNNKEVVVLYPLMPTKYSSQKRKELRKFEKELLKGKKIFTWLKEKTMKCKTCNGLGRTKATEFIGVDEGLRDVVILCPTCGGKGEVESLTEQEYIQTCNHKELTEILFRMIVNGSVIRPDRQYISEWLKQPHTPIS